MAHAERTIAQGSNANRQFKALALLLALAAGLSASMPALARHGHSHHGPRVHFGFVFGGPVFPHWNYPPRYYYPPPVVVVPASPPAYIEQGQAPAAASGATADSDSYWYFCKDSNTYYPYVKSCPGGWQRVTPQPPPD